MRSPILQILFTIGLIAALIFFSGFYPVALVNRRVILASDFYSNLAAAKKFYDSQKLYSNSSAADWESPELKLLEKDIQSAVLQNLVEDRILINKSGQVSGLKGLLFENLNQILSQVSGDLTNEGLANLYGWDIRTFKKVVLEPEARRKTFIEGFARQGRDFNEWFSREKRGANVKILLNGFVWNQNRGQVESKR